MIGHIRSSTWVEFGALVPDQHTPAVAAFFAITRLGHESVLVFFVLSGALVGGQIISRLQTGQFSALAYAIDRSSRILLPLIPACILTAIITRWYLHEPIRMGAIIANMIGLGGITHPLLHNNVPLWSLSYEIWFYILGGAVACLIAKTNKSVALGVVITSFGVFTVLTPSYLLYWCLGALVTLCLDIRRSRAIFAFVIGAAMSVCGLFLYETSVASKSIEVLNYVRPEFAELIFVAGIGLLFPLLYSRQANEWVRFLAKPASTLSACSYTIYLVHYPVLVALDTILPRAVAIDTRSIEFFLLRAAVCTGVAVLFYFAFERNTAALRSWLRTRLGVYVTKAAPALTELESSSVLSTAALPR